MMIFDGVAWCWVFGVWSAGLEAFWRVGGPELNWTGLE